MTDFSTDPKLPSSRQSHPTDCGCGPQWQKPKPNGTCATCGGWLPGERPRSYFGLLTEPEPQGGDDAR